MKVHNSFSNISGGLDPTLAKRTAAYALTGLYMLHVTRHMDRVLE